VPDVGDIPEVTLKLSPGFVIDGIVVNVNGQPVGNVIVRVEQLDDPFLSVAVRTNDQGRFRATGLTGSVRTMVTAVAGATASRTVFDGVPRKPEDPIRRESIRLKLMAGVQLSGRVMKRGQPVPGITLEMNRTLPGQQDSFQPFTRITTDREGRFLVGGFEPGDGYQFEVLMRDGSTVPDWHHESPFIQLIAETQEGVLELPDINLIVTSQSLSGRVVDPDGNPVSGISVSARTKGGVALARRERTPPPWTETDLAGEFQLNQLPDEAIELMAYKRNPAGGRILYPVHLETDFNQTGIRIVLDPRLLEGVEDLDGK